MPKKTSSTPNVISALTARTHFGQILTRVAHKNERFVVDRRGQPQAVIMSLSDYVDTFAPAPDWLEAIAEEAEQRGLHKLTMREIDAEIAAVRRERDSK